MNLLRIAAPVFLSYPAVAQIEHGTVGVVHLTEDKISVAADSRVTIKGPHPRQDDTACKIVALGKNLIFVSAGNTAYESHNLLVPSWTNNNEVRMAYERINSGNIREIATEWGRSVSSHFDALNIWEPNDFRAARAGDLLTIALFAGIDSNDALVLFRGIVFATDFGLHPAGYRIDQVTCPAHNFCVIGEPEIVIEFLDAATDRANEEAAKWAIVAPFAGDYDFDMFRAIRMVDLTITLHQGNDVGGLIDAAQIRWLDLNEPIYWYTRKENCPAH
jgi:hypothetical protein